MKRFVRAAFAASLFAASAGALLVPSSAQADEKVSKAESAPLLAAQKATQAGDLQGALTALQAAQAVPDRTPYDDYVINRFLSATEANLKDYPKAGLAFDAITASPELALQSDADKKAVYHDSLVVNGILQHWQTVVTDGQQLEALKANDDATYAEIAIAYYTLKDTANAQAYAQKSIDMAKAAGKQPEQAALQIVMNSQASSHDQSAALATLETMAVSYNSPDSWRQLTEVALGTRNLKDIDALYIYRLRFATGAMGQGVDFLAMASVANQLGYPTEALSVLQQGITSGKISGGQAGAQLTKARSGANEDERQLASLAAAAEHAKTGESDVKQAEDYWGYGRYADAETFARSAIAKGGLKDPSEGAMILGMALVEQNKNDDAIAAFAQVSGSEGRTKAAHLWSLYAQARKKAAGSAAPAH
jgi:hypothetical protein